MMPNPTREEIAHTLQILENTMQMSEPVRVKPWPQSQEVCPFCSRPECNYHQRGNVGWLRNAAMQTYTFPVVRRNRDLLLCGLRVLSQLIILALALLGLGSVLEKVVGR